MTDAPPDWLVDFLDGISLWDAIAILATTTAVVWFIAKKGWRSVIAFARSILTLAKILESVQGLPRFIDRTDEKLLSIYHETHNNDGTSLKDSSDRTELALRGLDTRLGEAIASLEGLHGRMDVVEREVKSLHQADEDLRADLEDTVNPKENGTS